MTPAPPSSAKLRLAYLGLVVLLAAIYLVAARAGLSLAAVAGFATLVWPPTGIALAALLLSRGRLWPGVFIGATVANVLTGAPPLVAVGIGVGNTLEALTGLWILRRIPGFRTSLDRLPDVIGLIILAAGLAPTISATIGVSSLYLGGLVSPANVPDAWRSWWLGDFTGALVVAPVILVWATKARHLSSRWLLEALAAAACVVAVSALVFGLGASEASPLGKAYLLYPLLIWVVLRFGQRGGMTAVFVVAVVALWATVLGHGPFSRPVLYQSLLALQVFIGVTAATFLVLGASVSERKRAIGDLEVAIVEQKRLHGVAAEANRAKSEFMAVVSHELRTPLNAIGGYTDLLDAGLEGPLTEKQKDYVERIRRNGRHLLGLIDEVLSFAKIEAGRLSFAFEDVRVGDMIATIETLIGPQMQKKGLTYEAAVTDASLEVRADPEKLRQILLNLVGNAIKFTEAGGRISVGAHRRPASPAPTTNGSMIEIWVRDTGIGIPPDQLERVAEPYFQGQRGSTRRYPGVGLGLSIARDLARAMHGDLQLASTVGEGTTATLTLPGG